MCIYKVYEVGNKSALVDTNILIEYENPDGKHPYPPVKIKNDLFAILGFSSKWDYMYHLSWAANRKDINISYTEWEVIWFLKRGL